MIRLPRLNPDMLRQLCFPFASPNCCSANIACHLSQLCHLACSTGWNAAATAAGIAASLRPLAVPLLSRALAAAGCRRAALPLLALLRLLRPLAVLPIQVPRQPCRPCQQVGYPLLPRDLLCLLECRRLLGCGGRRGGGCRRIGQVGKCQAGGPLLLLRCRAA